MTIRYLALGGAAAAIALGALALDASSAATTTTTTQAVTPAPARATTPVNKVANPMTVLAKLPVQTAQGQMIGAVETVVTGSDGHALVISIKEKTNKLISIEAAKLGFDPTHRLIVANLTAAELKALPRQS